MKITKIVANSIAKLSVNFAKVSCGAASLYGLYQPKEPVNMAERLGKTEENTSKN